MKHFMLIIAVVGSSLCWAFAAAAKPAPPTGNDLYGWCQSGKQGQSDYQAGFCDGFIVGTTNNLALLGMICPSNTVNGQQMIDVAKKYLDQHPEVRDRSASVIVNTAMHDVFQCSKPKP